MSTLHAVLGAALVAANLGAGALGAWAWWRARPSRAFWPLLRGAQLLVVVTAAQGGVLAALGRDLPELHLVYGLVPLGVSFLAEQLRLASVHAVLAAEDLDGMDAVRRLSEARQQALVRAIVRRETGVMAASALVVAVLGARAGGLL